MPFLAHLAALLTHLMRASAYILCGALIAFVAKSWVFDEFLLAPQRPSFVTYQWFCALGQRFEMP